MQRKLTLEELKHIDQAVRGIGNMCHWTETQEGHSFWAKVVHQLHLMLTNKTTDGKPYVDPEPPIPDGYRKATRDDQGRSDMKFRDIEVNSWDFRPHPQQPMIPGHLYIVPVDRTPTDDDAKGRPVVMVRDHDGQNWTKRVLLAVVKNAHYKFVTTGTEQTGTNNWRFCRYPYPNETP